MFYILMILLGICAVDRGRGDLQQLWWRAEPLFWRFCPDRSSCIPPSHNLLVSRTHCHHPPFHSLSAAQGTAGEKVRVTAGRRVTPSTLETQQASRRQTQSCWAATARLWTPAVPRQAWEKYSLKLLQPGLINEGVWWEAGTDLL